MRHYKQIGGMPIITKIGDYADCERKTAQFFAGDRANRDKRTAVFYDAVNNRVHVIMRNSNGIKLRLRYKCNYVPEIDRKLYDYGI